MSDGDHYVVIDAVSLYYVHRRSDLPRLMGNVMIDPRLGALVPTDGRGCGRVTNLGEEPLEIDVVCRKHVGRDMDADVVATVSKAVDEALRARAILQPIVGGEGDPAMVRHLLP